MQDRAANHIKQHSNQEASSSPSYLPDGPTSHGAIVRAVIVGWEGPPEKNARCGLLEEWHICHLKGGPFSCDWSLIKETPVIDCYLLVGAYNAEV